MIAEVAEDIVQYIELPHLQNHILAIDDPSLHSTLQVLTILPHCVKFLKKYSTFVGRSRFFSS